MGNGTPAPVPAPPPESKCWRYSPDLDDSLLRELKEKVESYSIPSFLNTKEARILMLGSIQAGKTSFVKTINSIFQDRIVQQSTTGSALGSLTMTYRQFKVRKKNEENAMNFRLCDTRGLESNGRPDLADLNYILEGNVPDGYEFSSSPIGPKITGFKPNPELCDQIHCVVFIFDANSVKATPENIWTRLNDLQTRMNSKEIPRLVLLTKIDKITDVSKVFYSTYIKMAIDYVSERLRLPPGNVMPIKNYEDDSYLNCSTSCLALQALDRMLGYANDFMMNQYDLMKGKK